jgi:hypothetical protein
MSCLDRIQKKFLRRLSVVDDAFERHLLAPGVSRRVDRFALQEGLISQLWQAWNVFCREVVISSTKGATTRAGIQTTSRFFNCTSEEIAYVAKRCCDGLPVNQPKPLHSRHEPTWGDLQKLNLIVMGIGASNGNTLASAFGVAFSIKDLQLCRNSCAHLTVDNIREVQASRVRYSDTNFSHPSELIYWTDPATKDFAWRTWVDEMEMISEFATA